MMNLLAKSDVKYFTVPEVLIYALVGFVIVICVLLFLMGAIKLLSLVVEKMTAKKDAPAALPEAAQDSLPAPEKEPVAPGRSGDVKLYDVPDKEAAMIMAIVADQLKAPLSTLNFISIKEVKDGKKQ